MSNKATKKDLEKALDIVEQAHEAETPAEVEKVVEASDKFEETVKDKALAAKVDEIVNKTVDSEEKSDTVEEVKEESKEAPKTEELSEEEKRERFVARRSKIAGGHF